MVLHICLMIRHTASIYEDPRFKLLKLDGARLKFPDNQFHEEVFTIFVYDLLQKLDDISLQQS